MALPYCPTMVWDAVLRLPGDGLVQNGAPSLLAMDGLVKRIQESASLDDSYVNGENFFKTHDHTHVSNAGARVKYSPERIVK